MNLPVMNPPELPENAGYTLRHAPPEQQRAFLAVVAAQPRYTGYADAAYSAQLQAYIHRIAGVWGGEWLNPEEGNRDLRMRCAQGHIIRTRLFYLRRGIWCAGCYTGSRRLTLSAVQALAARHNGVCLSVRDIRSGGLLTWQCEHGHTWESPPDSVKAGNWCPVCRRQQKNARLLQNMKTIAEKNGGECLSAEYVNSSTKLRFRCALGHEWETTPHIIAGLKKSWCPVCRYDRRRGTLDTLQALAAERGGKCLATVFTTVNDKVRWQCASGHVWEATPAHVRSGTWCPSCFYLSLCRSPRTRKKYLPADR